jgi:nitroimidazol reductase NimA-like FMN-containing flavoprotein (pyridoxamine 5'-phosphate oxidase superfamily)
MFTPMRRKDRAMPEEQARALLEKGIWGTLATQGEGDWPCAVPLSYVVMDNTIYFHCARSGQKSDNMRLNPKVSFCVVGENKPVFEGDFTTNYESVVVYGIACEVTEQEEKTESLLALCQKYLPVYMDKADASIAVSIKATAVWGIEIQHITGKRRPVGKTE